MVQLSAEERMVRSVVPEQIVGNWSPDRGRVVSCLVLLTACLVAFSPARAAAPDGNPAALTGLKGGLIVQLGTADTETPIALSRTGRYLVHILGTSSSAVANARARCRAEGYYGLVSVRRANFSSTRLRRRIAPVRTAGFPRTGWSTRRQNIAPVGPYCVASLLWRRLAHPRLLTGSLTF